MDIKRLCFVGNNEETREDFLYYYLLGMKQNYPEFHFLTLRLEELERAPLDPKFQDFCRAELDKANVVIFSVCSMRISKVTTFLSLFYSTSVYRDPTFVQVVLLGQPRENVKFQ